MTPESSSSRNGCPKPWPFIKRGSLFLQPNFRLAYRRYFDFVDHRVILTDRSLVEGKRLAGLFTAGGDAFDGMDLCVETLRRIAEYGKAEYVGTIAAVECGEPADVRRMTQVRRAAARLARAL